jgi:hypothetical protein
VFSFSGLDATSCIAAQPLSATAPAATHATIPDLLIRTLVMTRLLLKKN